MKGSIRTDYLMVFDKRQEIYNLYIFRLIATVIYTSLALL